MSTDPSPWADIDGEAVSDEPMATTQEMLQELEQERVESERAIVISQKQWEAFANRLTLKGDLIR